MQGACDEERLPLVEIFSSIQGEGTCMGQPSLFVRLFGCNLRCTWCDTPYSYAPALPTQISAIAEIVEQVQRFPQRFLCLTGGEPLLYGERSLHLLQALAALPHLQDVVVETNGAIDLTPFQVWRQASAMTHVRFAMDYKLPASGEEQRMVSANWAQLQARDEVKFVIADEADFQRAMTVVKQDLIQGIPLFGPAFGHASAAWLVQKMLAYRLTDVRLNVQLHKWIWHADTRGV